MRLPRCVIFEDEHLLVANKPAGMNTHAPSPFAGAGIYEWLRHREPSWSRLAIIHRLDKETSGVMVFGKSATANRSLTEQFAEHTILKKYLLITDQPVKRERFTITSSLVRIGEKYSSRPLHAGGERAETRFRVVKSEAGRAWVEAQPVTGRTHQIRAHAAAKGFAILGDTLYGGTAAQRVFLHAEELTLKHPVTGAEMKFSVAADFEADTRLGLREAFIGVSNEQETALSSGLLDTPLIRTPGVFSPSAGEGSDMGLATNAYRLIHGAADGWPGWYVERLGEFLLSQSERPLTSEQLDELQLLLKIYAARGVYHKILTRHVRRTSMPQASPQLVLGGEAPDAFSILENGTRFELSFKEGYSVGLFLDQRENRRRLLANWIAADFPLFPNGPAGAEVLNTFAYTCGFSVCAAKAGARATSLDLSKKYLEWGRRNFGLNQIDAGAHDFIFGDALDWLRRLEKKGRTYDLIVLDPPTFSQSKATGAFQAEKDYGRLASAALPLLKPDGVLFAATNAARSEPENFLAMLATAMESAGRKIRQQHYEPQPPDFPVHRDEPAYLKTVWLRVE